MRERGKERDRGRGEREEEGEEETERDRGRKEEEGEEEETERDRGREEEEGEEEEKEGETADEKQGQSPRTWTTMCSDLKKGFLLFQMFTDEWNDVVDLCCWPQFISSTTPVLISSVFLL